MLQLLVKAVIALLLSPPLIANIFAALHSTQRAGSLLIGSRYG